MGDLPPINDVFPKDWVSFFSGRPQEYLKIGLDGFRARYSSEALNVELLLIPIFEPDNLPTSERDPTVPNSQARFLLGYQRQLWEDFSFGTQYYGEVMQDYSSYRKSLPAEFPLQKRYRDTVTLRLEQLLKHQIWKLSLFVCYNRE